MIVRFIVSREFRRESFSEDNDFVIDVMGVASGTFFLKGKLVLFIFYGVN